MNEQERWEAWERGEGRCPMCVGLMWEDFEVICDCSRLSWEADGMPLTIQVIGRPDTETTVIPKRFVK